MKNNNPIGYFNYFKELLGGYLYIYIFLNFLVGLLDSIGLVLFIPLLSIATQTENPESLGKLQYIIDFIQYIGVELSLINVLIIMVLIFMVKGLFYYIRGLCFAKIRLIAVSKLRFRLIKNLQELSYKGFTKLEVGRIQNTMIGELNKVVISLNTFSLVVQHLIMLITYVGIAILSNWQFSILVALGGLISNILFKSINSFTKKKSQEISSMGHNFNELLIQVLNHFKYLKVTNYFPLFTQRLKNSITEQERLQYKVSKISTIGDSSREPLTIIIIVSMILIQVSVFENSFSSILASLLLFYRALSHLGGMQHFWSASLINASGIDSFEKLLKDFEIHKEENLHHHEAIESIDQISINNISLSYGGLKVIDNISFSIKKNTSIAFVGESGAGKTTLANIISGLIPPDEGSIVINDKSLYQSNLNSFRKNIGYITQEAVIFNDSIFNNVTFWGDKNEDNLQKFHKTIDNVALKDFVNTLPNQEDAILGNNGILISGGQKQRISIARELYKNVDLLVMDEATSALDTETERHIKNSIDLLQGQTTLIIIAHRLSTIKDVDVIYLLDKGKIIGSGSFDELLSQSEKFRTMVELQKL